jgi:hypothetical protein
LAGNYLGYNFNYYPIMATEKNPKKEIIPNVLIGSLVVFIFLSISAIVFFLSISSLYPPITNYPPQITIITYNTPTTTSFINKVDNSIATPTPKIDNQRFSKGLRVKVHGTGGDGLRVHQEAGQSSPTIYLAQENEILTINDGPVITGGFEWWKIESTSAEYFSGWVVEDFLQIMVSTT